MAVAALITTVAISAAAAYKQNQNQQAAAKAQKRANQVSQAEQQAQRQQQIRQQIREDRVRRAQILQGAENMGVSDSSGEYGAIGQIGTSTAGNIGTLNRGQVSSDAYAGWMQSAADDSMRANTWAAIGQVSSSIGSMFSGSPAVQGKFDQLFGTGNTGINAPPKG